MSSSDASLMIPMSSSSSASLSSFPISTSSVGGGSLSPPTPRPSPMNYPSQGEGFKFGQANVPVDDSFEDNYQIMSTGATTYQQLVDERDLSVTLKRLGYSILKRIIMTTNGVRHVDSLKVRTYLGDVAYMEMDKEGEVLVSPSDLQVYRQASKMTVPNSVKTMAMECATMETNAAVLECQCPGGLCYITKDPKSDAVAEQMIIDEMSTEDAITEAPTAYPLIKLSEVLEDPVTVAQMVNTVSKRFRKARLEQLVATLGEVSLALSSLANDSLAMARSFEAITDVLASDRGKAEKMVMSAIRNGASGDVIADMSEELGMVNKLTNDVISSHPALQEIKLLLSDVNQKVLMVGRSLFKGAN